MATAGKVSSEMKLRVKLHPFRHQVSGSTLMFRFDSNTICKPLLPQEYHFYKYLPDSLKSFTADYKGSIELHTEEESDGTVTFYGLVSNDTALALDLPVKANSLHKGNSSPAVENFIDLIEEDEDDFRLKRSGSVEMNEDSLDCYDKPTTKLETGRRLNTRLALLLAETPGCSKPKFILLENLVSSFKQPSVLDLKMGTRTHGDDDTVEKKQSKIEKCKRSTSSTLGVRLHGMQKYNRSNGKFETLSKYDGLGLSPVQFKDAMLNFLHDGVSCRTDLASHIYSILTRFRHCLSQQDTFRFYSSSLLIIYDGYGPSLDANSPQVKVKAIDFAHTIHELSPYVGENGGHKGPDGGYLLGITTLIDTFKGLMSQ